MTNLIHLLPPAGAEWAAARAHRVPAGRVPGAAARVPGGGTGRDVAVRTPPPARRRSASHCTALESDRLSNFRRIICMAAWWQWPCSAIAVGPSHLVPGLPLLLGIRSSETCYVDMVNFKFSWKQSRALALCALCPPAGSSSRRGARAPSDDGPAAQWPTSAEAGSDTSSPAAYRSPLLYPEVIVWKVF